MKSTVKTISKTAAGEPEGFTLIELMVAMAITAILMATIYMAFNTQQKSQVREQMVLEIQQNVRAVLQMMEKEIRMAGHDPTVIWGTDGIDNRPYDEVVDDSAEAENDRMADQVDNDCDTRSDTQDDQGDELIGIKIARAFEFRFTMDLDGNRDYCGANEQVKYGFALKYDGNKGPRDGWADFVEARSDAVGAAPLGRATGNNGNLMPIAEQIEALAFAYAFDADQDGLLDSNGKNVIWAYDGDGNGGLDTILDTNNDGQINTADDTDNNGRINAGDGAGLSPEIGFDRIRAVKIWLLARTRYPVRGYREKDTYVVGDKIVRAADINRDGSVDQNDAKDNYQRRLLSTTVVCRNMGLGL